MTYLHLFVEFAKIGLFSVGGGLATLPFLYDIAARFPEWFSNEELVNMIAISQSTPGPIGINMATYAGYNAGAVLGSVIATFSIVLPALVFMMFIARGLEKFNSNKLVQSAFYGLRPAVVALIAYAGIDVFRISVLTLSDSGGGLLSQIDIVSLALFAVMTAVMQFKKVIKWHPAAFIAIGAIFGIVFQL